MEDMWIWQNKFDAQEWVEKWMATIAEHPEIVADEGAMLGWFANAIMAGYDKAHEEQRIAYVEKG